MDRTWTTPPFRGSAFSQSAFGSSPSGRTANPFAGAGRLTQNTAQRIFSPTRNPFQRGTTTPSQSNPFGRSSSMASRLGYGGSPVGDWTARSMANMDANYGLDGGFGPGAMGSANVGQAMPTGPSFAGGNLDDATAEINAAANKWGVPANLIKAILAKESTGDWNAHGNRSVYLASRGERILGYSGIMESTARAWGYDFNALQGSRALQIDAVANGLARLYNQVGGQYGWDGVINTYYSGDPTGTYTPGDSWQYGSTQQYLSQVKGWWQQLDAMSGSPGQYGGPVASGTGTWQAWSGNFPITQEHGPTPFSQGAGAWMYGYAASVGVNGHPGLDIGMPAGTSVVTPVGGTVVIAGGSGYYRDVNGDGPGRGELRIQLDNGDILILGHMRSINVQVGQRVSAGQAVGLSGSFNGDHLHYEIRKYTPGATSSGYTAVDPRQYFSGNSWTASGSGSPMGSQRGGSRGAWWMNSLNSLFGG